MVRRTGSGAQGAHFSTRYLSVSPG
jgi:hypothetical protein